MYADNVHKQYKHNYVIRRAVNESQRINVTGRNVMLTSLAGTIMARNPRITLGQLIDKLLHSNQLLVSPLNENEVITIATSIYKYGRN